MDVVITYKKNVLDYKGLYIFLAQKNIWKIAIRYIYMILCCIAFITLKKPILSIPQQEISKTDLLIFFDGMIIFFFVCTIFMLIYDIVYYHFIFDELMFLRVVYRSSSNPHTIWGEKGVELILKQDGKEEERFYYDYKKFDSVVFKKNSIFLKMNSQQIPLFLPKVYCDNQKIWDMLIDNIKRRIHE